MKKQMSIEELRARFADAFEIAMDIAEGLQEVRQGAMTVVRAYRDDQPVTEEMHRILAEKSETCYQNTLRLETILDDIIEAIDSSDLTGSEVTNLLRQVQKRLSRLESYAEDMQTSRNDLFYAAGFLNNLPRERRLAARESSIAIRRAALEMEKSVAHLRYIRNRAAHSF